MGRHPQAVAACGAESGLAMASAAAVGLLQMGRLGNEHSCTRGFRGAAAPCPCGRPDWAVFAER